MQLKLSRVQFLKRLSLTDLDQDSVGEQSTFMYCITYLPCHRFYKHMNINNRLYLSSVCSFGVAQGVGGKMSLYLATRQSPYCRKPWSESPSSCFCSQRATCYSTLILRYELLVSVLPATKSTDNNTSSYHMTCVILISTWLGCFGQRATVSRFFTFNNFNILIL